MKKSLWRHRTIKQSIKPTRCRQPINSVRLIMVFFIVQCLHTNLLSAIFCKGVGGGGNLCGGCMCCLLWFLSEMSGRLRYLVGRYGARDHSFVSGVAPPFTSFLGRRNISRIIHTLLAVFQAYVVGVLPHPRNSCAEQLVDITHTHCSAAGAETPPWRRKDEGAGRTTTAYASNRPPRMHARAEGPSEGVYVWGWCCRGRGIILDRT